jgi:hypothetical protein
MFVCLSAVQAQNLNERLAGKWGLSHYIEFLGDEQDTLFTVHDCQNEYISFDKNTNYQFLSTRRAYKGKWSVDKDSLLYLKKSNGKVRVTMMVREISDDKLVLTSNQYMEVYFRCQDDDTQTEDTREEAEEEKIKGILVGIHMQTGDDQGDTLGSSNPFIEVGLASGKFSWNRTYFGWSAGIEAAPWVGTYGANFSLWSQKSLAYGLNLNTYTDFTDVNVGMKVMLGFSPRFLGEFGERSHFIYAYNLFFLGEGVKPIVDVHKHSFAFRTIIPLKIKTKKVRVIR